MFGKVKTRGSLSVKARYVLTWSWDNSADSALLSFFFAGWVISPVLRPYNADSAHLRK